MTSLYMQINFFLILISIISISSKLISPIYNKGQIQDPNIDKEFSGKNGLNLYYFNSGSQQTMYNVELNPNTTLEMSFKIYTNSDCLIKAFDKGDQLYFGFDFMFENKNGGQYNTDIIICSFDKLSVKCSDYIYDIKNNKYIRNDNGAISPNFLLPFGFQNITLNVLDENIIGYKKYFCIRFSKIFTETYDNSTVLLWVNYLSNDLIHKVSGFYGITMNNDDLNEIPLQFPIYYNKLDFENGSGLKINKNDIRLALIFIKYIFILAFTFWQ